MCETKAACKCAMELPGDSSIIPMCCKTETKLVSRAIVNEAIAKRWCPKCGKQTKHTNVPTYMPGIIAQTCNECSTHYQANFLEDDADMIRAPVDLTFPSLEELEAMESLNC